MKAENLQIVIRIQIGKNYWDLETYRKSKKISKHIPGNKDFRSNGLKWKNFGRGNKTTKVALMPCPSSCFGRVQIILVSFKLDFCYNLDLSKMI